MPGVFLCCLSRQANRGALLAGVLLCRSVCQALKGAPWVGSYAVVQCIRLLMGRHVVQLLILACGETEPIVMASSVLCDSAVLPCFLVFLAFLHQHFPPLSPPSYPLNPSLLSQQQPLLWDCSTIPKLQFPATAPSRRPALLSGVCMAVARTDSHSI